MIFKETLIMTATHGDEGFSIPIIEKLSYKFDFEWLIANPDALRQNRRYIDCDLNRSGPGNPNPGLLEQRLAFRLIAKGSEFRNVIDIHGTTANSGVFIILSDANWQNIQLAKKFDIKNVVLWPGFNPFGPLTQFIPSSLEIECGPKNEIPVHQELEKVLTNFFNQQPPTVNQSFFSVTGTLSNARLENLKDFQETTINGITFYPLLTGQYSGISCYMMQKLNNDKIIYD